MWKRDDKAATVPPRRVLPAVDPQLSERRARVLERRLSTPSTFASRAAQTEPVERQLVSMGMTEIVTNLGIHDAKTDVREGELFCDKDHPTHLFIRMGPREPLQALYDTTSRTEESLPLPPMKTRPRLAGAYDSAPADPPARPV